MNDEREQILAAHDAYLRANAAYDWPALKAIWSDDPTNVFFNMNGHTYVGLEQWTRLWQYYAQHKQSGWWEPFDVKVIVRGDMAVVTCHRKTTSRWRPETGTPDAGHQDKSFISRSTMVLVKDNGASDLLVKLYGERGLHARSAVAMGSLPSNVSVEIELIVEVT